MRDVCSWPRLARWMLPGAFGGLVGLLVLTGVLRMMTSRAVAGRVDGIVENALRSVELLGQMSNDLTRRRTLTGEHVLEADPARRRTLESRLAAAEIDFNAAARAYEPLTTYPSEVAAWQHLKGDAARADERLDEALDLSRHGRSVEAGDRFRAMRATFSEIDEDVATLIKINTAQAEQMRRSARNAYRRDRLVQDSLWLLMILVTVGTGAQVTRMARRTEENERRFVETLQARNRDLDAFAGQVAHELRGPLNTIAMTRAAIMHRWPHAERQAELIRRAVDRMAALIEDLLNLSRVEGAATAGRSDPAAVVAEVQSALSERIREAGASVHVAVERDAVGCTESLFRQVVCNLLENALKYRRPEIPVEIEVTGRVEGDEYEMRIKDNGIGMSTDEARHAFDPLFRAPRVRDVPGTGIGLSIVKRVLDACGGSVSIESALGRGTVMTIRLPRFVGDMA